MKNTTNPSVLHFSIRTFLWTLVFTATTSAPAFSQVVDPTWSVNPIIHALSSGEDKFLDLKLDNAGRIVTVGWTPDDDEGNAQRVVVTRRLPDGTLDPNFDGINNGNGIVYIDEPAKWNKAYALEIQPDNKIVIAGENNVNPLVFRLNENGTLDNTFGAGGIATVSVTGTFFDLIIQPDGKITAAGVVYNGVTNNSEDYLLARFTTNGQLDNQFDFDGKATYTIFDDDAPAAANIQLQPDGKYVIVGSGNRDGVTTDDATLARVLPNGQLDANFAFNGVWYSYATGDDYGNDVLVLPSGQILTCGTGRFSSDDVIELRLFSQTGTWENSWIYYPLADDYDYGYSLARQCDGKILVLGQSNSQTVIIRLNADMSLDQTWGINGYVFLEVGYIDYPRVVRVYGDKVYVSGYVYNSGTFDYDPFILRFNNTPVGATPTITSSVTTICPGGSSVTLTASGCPTCQAVWYRNGTPTGQTTSQITVNTAGTYTAAYQNGDCGVGSLSNAITITAGTQPNAAMLTPSGTVTACTGSPLQLTANSVCSGCTIAWYKNNSLITGQSSTTLNITTSGTYHAVVSNGCPSQTSNQTTVNIVSPPNAATIVPAGPISICNGQPQTITANNVCNGCSVNWYQNGAPLVGQTGTSIQVSSPGSYTCTVSNGACNSPSSNQVLATTLPAATPPSVSASATVTCTTVALTAANVCSQCTVNWYNSNGSLIGTGNAIQVPPGTYYAKAKNSCPEESLPSNNITVGQAQFTATINVDNCTLCVPGGSNYAWYLNNQLISNASGSCWTATVSGNYFVSMTDLNGCMGVTPTEFVSCISDVENIEGIDDLRVFPNPANEQVTFELNVSLTLDLDIQLFASDGKWVGQVLNERVPPGVRTVMVQTSHLPSGLYFYKISTDRGVSAGRLAIEH